MLKIYISDSDSTYINTIDSHILCVEKDLIKDLGVGDRFTLISDRQECEVEILSRDPSLRQPPEGKIFVRYRRTQHLESRFPNLAPYFRYAHLPERLQPVSKACHDLYYQMRNALPDNAEKYEGMRKLLEAKDCFVRANLDK